MIRRIDLGWQPSAYAVKTFAQRKGDYESALASGRDLFKPTGGQASFLTDDAALELEGKIRTGNGWVIGPDNAASTWIRQYGYWAQGGRQGLAIQFKSGAICFYAGCNSPSWAFAMQGAASKGRFVHQYLYKKQGYELVSN